MAYVSYNNTLAYITSGGGLPNSNPNALGGLRFNSSGTQRVTTTLTGQNINLAEFSLAISFKVPNSPPAVNAYGICFIGPSAGTVGIAKNIAIWLNGDGSLQIYFRNDEPGTVHVTAIYNNFIQEYKNKIVHFVFIRNLTGNPSIYINGLNVSSSFSFGANGWTWQSELTSTYFTIGTIVAGAGFDFLGDIYYASIYNLALSSADVLEIYSNHGIVPFKYQWGSFNSLVTGDDSTFASDTGFWSKGNNPPATISGGRANLNTAPLANIYRAGLLPFGKAGRITFNVIAADTTQIYISDLYITTLQGSILGTGVKTYTLIGGPNGGIQVVGQAGTAIIDDLTFFRLGAVVHYSFERNTNDSSSNALNASVVGNVPFLGDSERLFATNFSAQNNTNFQRIKRIGKELDYYIQTGPKSSTISTTVVPVSGFTDNQLSTFLSYTGDSVSGFSIDVPQYVFDKCFLKSMSVSFEPWKLTYANLQFDSYGLASGSGIYVSPPEDVASPIITPLRATSINLITGSGFNRNITEYENISFEVSVDRAANFEIGQEYPTRVSVAKITKTLQINGVSNLNWVSDYEPNKIISCSVGMADGNSISVSGVVSTQSLSIDANGVAKTNLTVIEEMV